MYYSWYQLFCDMDGLSSSSGFLAWIRWSICILNHPIIIIIITIIICSNSSILLIKNDMIIYLWISTSALAQNMCAQSKNKVLLTKSLSRISVVSVHTTLDQYSICICVRHTHMHTRVWEKVPMIAVDGFFSLVGIQALQHQWKKCVGSQIDNVKK